MSQFNRLETVIPGPVKASVVWDLKNRVGGSPRLPVSSNEAKPLIGLGRSLLALDSIPLFS